MSDSAYTQLLDLACGAFLLAAVVVLWRRDLATAVRVFALQGLALAAVAALLGAHEHRWDLLAVAAGIGVLRAWALPALMRRALAAGGGAGGPPPVDIAAAPLRGGAPLRPPPPPAPPPVGAPPPPRAPGPL